MKIACVQFAPALAGVQENLETIARLVREVDADLVVLPELATTGYSFITREEAYPYGEDTSGSTATTISELARECRLAIVTGILERSGESLYNSAICFDRDGRLALHYRKVHLFHREKLVFTPGDLGFPVTSLTSKSGEFYKLGCMVCYDWRFPEAARSLALAGAEIIAIPSNIVTTTGMLHPVLRVRAFENKAILAFADRVGLEQSSDGAQLEFRGESAILNFNGEVLAAADGVSLSIVTAEVSPEATRNKAFSEFNDIFGDRRAGQYRA